MTPAIAAGLTDPTTVAVVVSVFVAFIGLRLITRAVTATGCAGYPNRLRAFASLVGFVAVFAATGWVIAHTPRLPIGPTAPIAQPTNSQP